MCHRKYNFQVLPRRVEGLSHYFYLLKINFIHSIQLLHENIQRGNGKAPFVF